MSAEWITEALCEGEDVNLFFDDYLSSEEAFNYVNKLCAECPVKTACLNFGMGTKSVGVWGGELLQQGVIVDASIYEEEEF